MILATDLRIGNYVLIDGEPEVVKAVDDQGINGSWGWDGMGYYFEFQYPRGHTLEPVPLTPEILRKCGFTATFDRDLPYQTAFRKDDIVLNQEYRVGVDIEGGVLCIGKPSTYVHQLQNLYFALTGQDLYVNL